MVINSSYRFNWDSRSTHMIFTRLLTRFNDSAVLNIIWNTSEKYEEAICHAISALPCFGTIQHTHNFQLMHYRIYTPELTVTVKRPGMATSILWHDTSFNFFYITEPFLNRVDNFTCNVILLARSVKLAKFLWKCTACRYKDYIEIQFLDQASIPPSVTIRGPKPYSRTTLNMSHGLGQFWYDMRAEREAAC